ncbi:MAG: VacB/RNase II family 3'-5' exoribonuclease [Thermodesulfobacteriota bacterium]
MRTKELSRRLGVPKEGRVLLKKVLGKMVTDGKIGRTKGGYIYSAVKEPTKAKTEPGRTNALIKGMVKGGKILGKFVRTGNTGKIIPKDDRIPHIYLQAREIKNLRNHSLVVFEISGGVSTSRKVKGHIVDVLGRAGDLEVEKKGLLVEYELEEQFPPEAMRELAEIPDEIPESEIRKRVDLRNEIIFTIDNDDAKDFDDAVGITRTHSGYRLLVSIADVSYYVGVGSEIDNQALGRGTSVYMPHMVVPMLPERLSNDLCSLVPYKDRLTKTVEMDFNRKGQMTDFKIYNSVIRSAARLTYSKVAARLGGSDHVPLEEKQITEKLFMMNELYQHIRSTRMEKGELNFDIPEPDLIRDELGRIVDVVRTQRNLAHGLIEEFMIAANTAVAVFTCRAEADSLYRIHEMPDEESMLELSEGLKKLGYTLSTGGKVDTLNFQRIINMSRGRPEEIAVNMLILRSLKRATYSTETKGHFGLAIKHYTHFTSPIRRYPDLIVHRITNSLLKHGSHPYDKESLDWVAEHASKKERYADEIEREAINLERAYLMKSYIGQEYEGVILSVLPFGMFVEVKEVFVEGLVPKDSIVNWRKRWFDIGQTVRVKVTAADVEKRRITLNLTS